MSGVSMSFEVYDYNSMSDNVTVAYFNVTSMSDRYFSMSFNVYKTHSNIQISYRLSGFTRSLRYIYKSSSKILMNNNIIGTLK